MSLHTLLYMNHRSRAYLQKLGHQDLDDELALSAIAYKGGMGILGVDNEEFTWGDNGLTNLVVRIKSIVVLLIEGCLTLTKSRDVLIGNSLGLGKGYVDVNVLAVQLKLNHIGGGQLGVNDIDEEVGTIKLNATWFYLGEVVGLYVVKCLFEQGMQTLITRAGLKMG